MDCIKIKNLEVFARHGVYSEERSLGQKFIVSAALYADLRTAGRSDELEESIDYGKICHSIKNIVEKETFKLIEAVAENLAERLLMENPALEKVWIEIKKPWAPVVMHLETVSVDIERSRHLAYIALGSNMGDREGHLRFAVGELENASGCRVVKVSGFANTQPYGNTDQDEFLNGCLELETLLSPHELLDLLHEIENQAGRVRNEHWGPRTLDLDIVYYDDLIMSDDSLRIPHAETHKRDFVLQPLIEIAPSKLHPILSKTASEMLSDLEAGK